MSSILTPVSLWKNFDDSLDTMPVTLGEKIENGIKYEYVTFSGRDTGRGRVSVYGIFASAEKNPSRNAILILPESAKALDEELLKMFVESGYSALIVDYCGKTDGAERYTVYSENIPYANLQTCGRFKDYVEESADKTSWYEWVAVGIYARKYLTKKLDTSNIGVVGIRDGGEIAWKLACAAQFSCVVTVCACGWKAYSGYGKFGSEEPELDEERYRFLAGIDSQSYAPYVRCPVLMLCSTNDPEFDYDRAYDTFSRINPDYADGSVISYSLDAYACIGVKNKTDMFMFLDKCVKQHQVFIPKPAEITIAADDEDNLVARASFDDQGIVDSYGMYMAEDSKNSTLRDWVSTPYKRKISNNEHEYYLNVYEKSAMVFALCYVKYSNGFTVWSKIAVKKLSGKFRNSQPRCKVLFSEKNGVDCFSIANKIGQAVGGIFLKDSGILPEIVERGNNLKGITSRCGLSTYRLNSPKYAPDKDAIIKFDVYPDCDTTLEITMRDVVANEVYGMIVSVIGGVWQSVILKDKDFKNVEGASVSDFTKNILFSITGKDPFVVNNLLWL